MAGAEPAAYAALAARIREERASLARVVDEAAVALDGFPEGGCAVPTPLVLRGMAGVLHDAYTGVERVLEAVAIELDGGVPGGQSSHRLLLRGATRELPGIRPPVLSSEGARALDEYLRFRHLVRHIYGFELEWSRVRALLQRLPSTWALVSADIDRFLAFLDALAGAP